MGRHLCCSLIAVVSLLVAGCLWETIDTSYESAEEVIDSGYLEKGWIPRWLPRDATDLQETHNIDSNASGLSFSIPRRESLELPIDCVPVAYENTVSVYIRRRWWPSDQELRESYVFFRCPADATDYTFVGVSKAGRRVLHWRTYAR